MKFKIADINLSRYGEKKIDWVKNKMPILNHIQKRFLEERPFKGKTIAMNIHLEAKTSYMSIVLKSGGANVVISGSDTSTVQDDCAAALVKRDISVFSWRNASFKEHTNNLIQLLNFKPDLILDDGAELISMVHKEKSGVYSNIIGATEETTCGITRIKSLERNNLLRYPVIGVNNAHMKYLFDNRYGTGQSTLEAIMHVTNMTICGKIIVIIGYGWVGKGLALRARGLGAKIIVCEVDPIVANEALMDGYDIMPAIKAAQLGDYFITATGNINVLRKEHFLLMKNGAVLANSGHFDYEICKKDLLDVSDKITDVRDMVQEYKLQNGQNLYLISEGHLVNLRASNGHPIEIIDLSFSLQCLALEYLVKNNNLDKKLYNMPLNLDKRVAELRLRCMNLEIDYLSEEQKIYLNTWDINNIKRMG